MEPALDGDDPKACCADRSLGVPRRLAAAEGARPEERVHGALHRAERGVRRADVLPEAELTAGCQHTAQLVERAGGVRHRAEDAGDDGGVEGPVLGRKGLGDTVDDLDRH